MRAAITCLAILAIFALLCATLPRLGGSEEARGPAAYADIHGGIKTALDSFKADNGFFPKTLQDLFQQPKGTTNWHGPYLELGQLPVDWHRDTWHRGFIRRVYLHFRPPNLPLDPWGDAYIYEFPGKHNTNSYDLMSAGPDGKAGTDDDIVNWTK